MCFVFGRVSSYSLFSANISPHIDSKLYNPRLYCHYTFSKDDSFDLVVLVFERKETGGIPMLGERKRVLIHVLVIFLLFAGALFALYPLSFEFDSKQDFQILFIGDNIEMDNYSALPTGDVKSYTISPLAPDYQALINSIESSQYTRCFHTLSSTYFPEGYGEGMICISWPSTSVYLCKNSSHLVVNSVVYHQTSSFDLYDVCWEIINGN